MIYRNEKSGVSKVVNNLSESRDFTISYRVGLVDKEATFNLFHLPIELVDEFARATNKIARYVEESPNLKGKSDK